VFADQHSLIPTPKQALSASAYPPHALGIGLCRRKALPAVGHLPLGRFLGEPESPEPGRLVGDGVALRLLALHRLAHLVFALLDLVELGIGLRPYRVRRMSNHDAIS
jgi:hypothetical protein